MIDLIRATFLIFRAQLWRTLRSRRTLVCACLAALPVLLALVISLLPLGDDPSEFRAMAGNGIAWNLVLKALVPILSLIGGAAVISEEIEDRTITYLLTSPIPRPAILLGRWAASFVWLGLLIAGSLAGVFLLLNPSLSEMQTMDASLEFVAANPDLEPSQVMEHFQEQYLSNVLDLYWIMVGIGALGCGVYSAGFAALGARVKHPMIIGLAYTFAIELFLSGLPGKTRTVTIQYYLASLANEWARPLVADLQSFGDAEFDPGPEALIKLGIVSASALLLGSWVLSRRQYVMSS